MQDLIDDVFVRGLRQPSARRRSRIRRGSSLADLAAHGDRLAFTTDSFVVDPLDFPGGDIGKLAVCGTVNDLAVGGARPLYLVLRRHHRGRACRSRRCARIAAARWRRRRAEAGVQIVTGDTKVVERGACDKLFINTTGIGVIRAGRRSRRRQRARPATSSSSTGCSATMARRSSNARGDMALTTPIESDCAPLHGLIDALLGRRSGVRASCAMRRAADSPRC